MAGDLEVCHCGCLELSSDALNWVVGSRVAESVVTLLRRNEPSKDLVSQSLSSKLTCERERWLKRLLNSCSQLRARSRERSAHKALELLLTARSREKSTHKALDLLLTCDYKRKAGWLRF